MQPRSTTLIVRPSSRCPAGTLALRPLAGDSPPAGAATATMACKQTCGLGGNRTNDDGERTNGSATQDQRGGMLAVGDEPNLSPAAPARRRRST